MMNDFTIVIQGPINRHITTMCLLQSYSNIVVSTWDDEMWTHPTIYDYLKPIERNNLKIVVNKTPSKEKLETVYNKQNRYLQFLSTLNGLEHVKTKYAIKVRSDEYYSDLLPIVQTLLMDDNKLVTNDVFFRRVEYLRYHPSDHIICGKTEKMKTLFKELLYDCESNQEILKYPPFNQFDLYIFAEQQLGMKWIEMHERDNKNRYKFPTCYEQTKELMIKHFDIVNNSMLGDFCINANSEKKRYVNYCGYYDPEKDIQTSLDEL